MFENLFGKAENNQNLNNPPNHDAVLEKIEQQIDTALRTLETKTKSDTDINIDTHNDKDSDRVLHKLERLNAVVAALAAERRANTAPLSPSDSDSSSDDGPEWIGEVEDLVRRKRHIEAIKVYREKSGLGMKDSMEAVNAIAARLADAG
jgi:ribosomal protein L7/L12